MLGMKPLSPMVSVTGIGSGLRFGLPRHIDQQKPKAPPKAVGARERLSRPIGPSAWMLARDKLVPEKQKGPEPYLRSAANILSARLSPAQYPAFMLTDWRVL